MTQETKFEAQPARNRTSSAPETLGAATASSEPLSQSPNAPPQNKVRSKSVGQETSVSLNDGKPQTTAHDTTEATITSFDDGEPEYAGAPISTNLPLQPSNTIGAGDELASFDDGKTKLTEGDAAEESIASFDDGKTKLTEGDAAEESIATFDDGKTKLTEGDAAEESIASFNDGKTKLTEGDAAEESVASFNGGKTKLSEGEASEGSIASFNDDEPQSDLEEEEDDMASFDNGEEQSAGAPIPTNLPAQPAVVLDHVDEEDVLASFGDGKPQPEPGLEEDEEPASFNIGTAHKDAEKNTQKLIQRASQPLTYNHQVEMLLAEQRANKQQHLRTQADRIRGALDYQQKSKQKPSFAQSPATKSRTATQTKTSTQHYDVKLDKNSLEWKLMEVCVALLDKPIRLQIQNSTPSKLNYARHFRFLVSIDPQRAKQLLERLIQIKRDLPKPKLSTPDYMYVIAGNPDGFVFKENLSAPKNTVAIITDQETDTTLKLQIKTSDSRTVVLYARKDNFTENETHYQFDAIIPLSEYLTSEKFLKATMRDQSGRTLLHWAAIGGSFPMLDTLATGLNLLRSRIPTITDLFPQFSSTDFNSNTVTHEIARSGLYQIKCNPNTTHQIKVERQNLSFAHPFPEEILDLSPDALASLLKHPHITFTHSRNSNNELPLHLLVSHNQTTFLRHILFNTSTQVDNIDQDLDGINGSSSHVSILHYAAMCPEVHWKTVAQIISLKPELLNTPDADGFTPTHYAAAACNVATLLLLISKNANLTSKSHSGDSPLTVSLSAYTFEDDCHPTPLHMSERIPSFNAIVKRRLTTQKYEITDEQSRYITREELARLDELLQDEAIMGSFTHEERQRLQLASLKKLQASLDKERYKRAPMTWQREKGKLATRMREYALVPIAIFQSRSLNFGDREKAAAYYNTRGTQVIRASQFYSKFFLDREFPLPAQQKKEFLIECDLINSGSNLEELRQPLKTTVEFFKVLLTRSISAFGEVWVTEEKPENGSVTKQYVLDEYGRKTPSWGQWWNGETAYTNIAIKILSKVESLLEKVEQTQSQLNDREIEIEEAHELNATYQNELLALIDEALRKADKKMLHVDKDTKDPATITDFRARCMVAKVQAMNATLTTAENGAAHLLGNKF